MRKVTTIHLNHHAWQVEEDGYEALRAYLDAAERALAGNPDRAEIMADLEQAIAEKIGLALGGHRNVAGGADIQRILAEMGPVADAAQPAAGAAGPAGAGTAGGAGTTGTTRRGLYRVLPGKMIAGACNGLAAWTGIEVTWIRVGFILLTIFTGGMWLLAYLAMVLIVPVAHTPEQLAAAYGHPVNAQELVDRARHRHGDRRSERRARRAARHGMWHASPGAPPQNAPGALARVAGGVLLPLLTLLSAAWFAAFAIVLMLLWWSWNNVSLTVWPPDGFLDLPHLPQWVAMVLVLCAYILVALPIGAGRRAALYYVNGGQPYGWANAWAGLLWIGLVALVLLAAWIALPMFQQLLHDVFGWPAYRDMGLRWV